MPITNQFQVTRRGFSAIATGAMISAMPEFVHAKQGHEPAGATPESAGDHLLPIGRFLSLTPAVLLEKDPEDGLPLWSFTDLAQQLNAFGITSLHDDPRAIPVTRAIYLNTTILTFAGIKDFTSALGFEGQAVHQIWLTGDGDRKLQMLIGDMPLSELPAVWEAVGYQRVTIADAKDAWTLGGPADFDFDHPIQSAVASDCNNIAISDDGVIVFARDLSMLELALQGQAVSMASKSEFAELVAQLPATVVGCEAVLGTAHTMDRLNNGLLGNPNLSDAVVGQLAESIERMVEESDREVGPMPEWKYMVMGVLAGTVVADEEEGFTPGGEAVCRIYAGDPTDAVQITDVVAHRWQTSIGEPDAPGYADWAGIDQVTTAGSVAAIDFSPLLEPLSFVQMEGATNMWPFLYGEYSPPE